MRIVNIQTNLEPYSKQQRLSEIPIKRIRRIENTPHIKQDINYKEQKDQREQRDRIEQRIQLLGSALPIKYREGKEDISLWKKTGEQAGSNEGGFFTDPNGNEWYCKFPSTENHVKNEILAAKLYNACRILVPEVKMVTLNGKTGIASKIIPGLKIDRNKLINSVTSNGSLAQGFGVDCWLSNWDVIGLEYDNAKVDDKGNVYRIDQGGSLLYRAQGTPKGDFFGDKVTETKTLLDFNINPQSASIFSKISKDAIEKSIARIIELGDDKIKLICLKYGPGNPEERIRLANKLIQRKKDLIQQFPNSLKS